MPSGALQGLGNPLPGPSHSISPGLPVSSVSGGGVSCFTAHSLQTLPVLLCRASNEQQTGVCCPEPLQHSGCSGSMGSCYPCYPQLDF